MCLNVCVCVKGFYRILSIITRGVVRGPALPDLIYFILYIYIYIYRCSEIDSEAFWGY